MDKVANMQFSPYQLTMFLDTDTYMCAEINEVFGLLDYYDICMAPEVGRPYWKDLPADLFELKECNTGVILFRNIPRVKELFSNWQKIYTERQAIDYHDQTSMAIALAQTKVRFGLLPSEYNLRADHCQVLFRKVRIIHARCRSYAKIAKRLNHPVDVGRNWIPSARKCVPIYGSGLSRMWLNLKKFIAPISTMARSVFKKQGDIVMPGQKRFQ